MKKGKQKNLKGRARLNVVIDADLKEFAQQYARRHCTQVTQLIVDHFLDLKEREGSLDVEQI